MIDVSGLHFRYPGSPDDALTDVCWRVMPGEFALMAGQSGSGKSTLLRCLNGLIPHFHGGFFGGDVEVFGQNTRRHPPRQLAATIGTVFQDPESQLVTDSPEDEILFALENLGFERAHVRARIEDILNDLGIEHLRTRQISTLSGGERQLVALAAALAPQPRAVLLDEPTSQLDPGNAQRVIDALIQQNRTTELSVVLAEHRLERFMPIADSIAHVVQGRVTSVTPSIATPALVIDGLLPDRASQNISSPSITNGPVIAALRELAFAYGQHKVLQDIDLEIRAGESIALTGPNGSGKTTLLKQIIGLYRPDCGQVQVDGATTEKLSVQEIARKVGYVPQQPTIMLHQETVEDELRFTLTGLRRSGDPSAALASVGLSGYEIRHPLDLSGGERQRLAIAAICVGIPRLLLLDEPTRGLPWSTKRDLANFLRAFAAEGAAVLVATHDNDFCRLFADRKIGLEDGRIVSDQAVEKSQFRTPSEDRDVAPLLTASNLD
jgi:energy-coupling factor transport system ATP-binding protein